MKNIVSFAERSYVLGSLTFTLLWLLNVLHIIVLGIDYRILSIVLLLLAVPSLLRPKPIPPKLQRSVPAILVTLFLFAFVIRIIPYARNAVPIGYDPGFYKYIIDVYAHALPSIPETDLASWIRDMHPQGLFILSDTLYVVAGASSLDMIKYFFPFVGAVLVFPIFLIARTFAGERAGIVAVLLYSVSYTQYYTFANFYFNNLLGLIFLLLAIDAAEKRRYAIMSLMFAALGIFHYPEFLIFSLVLVPVFLARRNISILVATIGTAALISPFWIPRWDNIWEIIRAVNTDVFTTDTGIGSGTFFSYYTYSAQVALVYLPFGFVGFVYLILKNKWNAIAWYFMINYAIVVFKMFFYKRLMIDLDIAVIILAGVGICHTLLNQQSAYRKVAIAVSVCLLLAGASVPTFDSVKSVRSAINEAQLAAIEWISSNTEPDAFVLTNTLDAPWVLAWSNRKVVAPGLFEWDVRSKTEWNYYFRTKDAEWAKDFLSEYEGPIYIYESGASRSIFSGFLLDKSFQKILQLDGAVVYKYNRISEQTTP